MAEYDFSEINLNPAPDFSQLDNKAFDLDFTSQSPSLEETEAALAAASKKKWDKIHEQDQLNEQAAASRALQEEHSQDIFNYTVIGSSIILIPLMLLLGNSFLTKVAKVFSTNKRTAFFSIVLFPITIPLYLLFIILKPVTYFLIGLFQIIVRSLTGITQQGKKQVANVPKSETVFDQLQQLTVQMYRSYAEKNNLAPTSKTSDEELLKIITLVQSAFTDAAEQKGEQIPATHLMTINVKFFQVYETVGKEFFSKHLEYEVGKYLNEGLRADYKKDLGII